MPSWSRRMVTVLLLGRLMMIGRGGVLLLRFVSAVGGRSVMVVGGSRSMVVVLLRGRGVVRWGRSMMVGRCRGMMVGRGRSVVVFVVSPVVGWVARHVGNVRSTADQQISATLHVRSMGGVRVSHGCSRLTLPYGPSYTVERSSAAATAKVFVLMVMNIKRIMLRRDHS
uniref:Uncharacterized protein n=1 Tax=Anopheles farauti TaxID=69004 RepID=A0A182QYY0_9DIPT